MCLKRSLSRISKYLGHCENKNCSRKQDTSQMIVQKQIWLLASAETSINDCKIEKHRQKAFIIGDVLLALLYNIPIPGKTESLVSLEWHHS